MKRRIIQWLLIVIMSAYCCYMVISMGWPKPYTHINRDDFWSTTNHRKEIYVEIKVWKNFDIVYREEEFFNYPLEADEWIKKQKETISKLIKDL